MHNGCAQMILFAYAALLGPASAGAQSLPLPVMSGEVTIMAQILVQRSSIVRVPPAAPPPRLPQAVRWKEKGAPNCIKWSSLAAAMVSSPTTIDLIVRGGTRYRVKLEKSCQAIDFYSGFYVKATKDGRVCEDRDSIHSRSGGECLIDKFKTLVPDK
jgi:hypothetical protein